MFGKNTIAGRRNSESYLVKELFYTIQGEGPWAGIPSVFVRFSDCNLACLFCDTDFTGGDVFSLTQLVNAIEVTRKQPGFFCRHIVLTGGEPMLQELKPLIYMLAGLGGLKIQIETAGTVIPPDMTEADWQDVVIVCSPKTPKVHSKIVEHANFWKYIIRAGETSEDDGLPEWSTQLKNTKARLYRPEPLRKDCIYVQPCDEGALGDNARNTQLTAKIAMQFGYRLSLQMHKIAGLP